MRRWLLLAVLVAVAFAVVERNRLFLRDPLGSVTRDGVREAGAQVYINFRNEILIENDHAPMYFNVLLGGHPVSAPETMKCIHYIACLLSGDDLPQTTAVPGAHMLSMDPRQASFRDGEGRQVHITLR